MTMADAEIPRRAIVRLVRFGFEDGERAARLLSDPALGLWDLGRNEPADPEAGPVVAALARAGDPDLAVRSLHRLVEALDRPDASGAAAATLLARLRGSGLLRTRLLAVLGASSGLADHLAAHPADWTVLDADADGHGRARPTPGGPPHRGGTAAADARGRRGRSRRPALGRTAGQGRSRRVAPARRGPAAGSSPGRPLGRRPRPR